MGIQLRIRHETWQPDDPSWAYGGFMRFRKRLATGIGIDLEEMFGFSEEGGRMWGDIDSPLVAFLNHSDCDGELSAAECEKVRPALIEAMKSWPEDDYDRVQGTRLAEYMAVCAVRGVPLDFC